jgi:hypothetical protein
MSKNPRKKTTRSRAAAHVERRITIQSVQRDRPDLRKLSRAVIALAQAEAEREAQAQHEQEPSDPEVSHE